MDSLQVRPMDGRTFARVGANFYEYASGSPLPPTHDEWVATGATVIPYDGTRTTSKPTSYVRDVLQTPVVSLDSTRYSAPVPANGGKRYLCPWARAITTVTVPNGNSGEWLTHALIAVTRDSTRAFVFDANGNMMGAIKVRKHYKPAWIKQQMGLAYMPRVNTIPVHDINGHGEKDIARKTNGPSMARTADFGTAPKSQYDEHVLLDDGDAIVSRRVMGDSLDMRIMSNIQTKSMELDIARIHDTKRPKWDRYEYVPPKRSKRKKSKDGFETV